MACLIPNRMSVRDPAYDAQLGVSLVVKVDGLEQRRVVEYDIEAGVVTRYAVDEAGRTILNEESDDLAVERVIGVVEVVLRPH